MRKLYYKNLNAYLEVLIEVSINLVIQLIEQLRNIISLMQYQLGFTYQKKKMPHKFPTQINFNNKGIYSRKSLNDPDVWASSKS